MCVFPSGSHTVMFFPPYVGYQDSHRQHLYPYTFINRQLLYNEHWRKKNTKTSKCKKCDENWKGLYFMFTPSKICRTHIQRKIEAQKKNTRFGLFEESNRVLVARKKNSLRKQKETKKPLEKMYEANKLPCHQTKNIWLVMIWFHILKKRRRRKKWEPMSFQCLCAIRIETESGLVDVQSH